MSTFYKYVERTADSYIDWATVGKDVNDMLVTENKRREDEKAALDKRTKEDLLALSNGPMGTHKGVNSWWLDFAGNGASFLKMQDDLMKSGNLKVRDFVANRQNLYDGTDRATKLVKSYQDEWAEKMKRNAADESQPLELWASASVEGYANFDKSRLYVNPATGAVSVGMVTKQTVDGKDIYTMDKNPNKILTMDEMEGRIAARYDKFDVNKALDTYVASVGESIRTIERVSKLGGKTVSEFLNAPDKEYANIAWSFEQAEANALKMFTSNPLNTASIMTMNIKGQNGVLYDFTQDKNEAKNDKTKIYVATDPTSGQLIPQYTPEQTKDVTDWLREQARLRYDQKMTVANVKYPAEFAPDEWRSKAAADKTRQADEGNFIGKLYSGTDAEVEAAVQHFNGRSTTAQLKRTPTGVTIIYKDGSSKPFNFKAGNSLVTKEDFIRGVAPMLLGDEIDVNQVLKGAVSTSSNIFNPKANVSATTTYKKSEYETYGEKVASNSTKAQTAIQGTEADAATKLTDLYGAYGFSFAAAADKKSQVTVTAPNQKTMTIKVNTNSTDADAVAKSLNSFIKGNGTSESIVAGNRLSGSSGVDYSQQ
jgi:hypothetical protein